MTVFPDFPAAETEIDLNVTSKTSSDRIVHTELASTLKRMIETTFGLSPFILTLETTDPPTGGSDGDVAWSVTDKLYVRIASVWTLTKTLIFGRYLGSHNAVATYLQDDLVYYTNEFYRANKNNGPSSFDPLDFDLAFNTPHSIITTGPIGLDQEVPTLAEIQVWYDINVGPAKTFDYVQSVLDLITYTTPLGRKLQYVRYTTVWTQIYNDSPSLAVTLNDFFDVDYFYHGGTITGWKINRYNKVTLQKLSATEINNPTHATLSTAWAARSTLIYSVAQSPINDIFAAAFNEVYV